jgi:hypothetical protein
MGRPRLQLDEGLIERLAIIHCNNTEIAATVGCSVDTLDRNYAELIAKGREKGKSSLRRMQFELAQKGNATMLIWLGKQILGQREPYAPSTVANDIRVVVEDYCK